MAECPHCGYVLGPFETHCPRCARLGPPPEPSTEAQAPPEATAPKPKAAASERFPWRLMAGHEPVGCVVGFWTRFWAALMDAAILFFPSLGLWALFGFIFGVESGGDAARLLQRIAFVVSAVTANGLYSTLLIGWRGQTVGMGVMGIQVIREGEGAVGYPLAFARWAVFYCPTLVPCAGSLYLLLNGLWVSWDRKKQALHDKACRTLVVATVYRGESMVATYVLLGFIAIVGLAALFLVLRWGTVSWEQMRSAGR